MKQALEKLFAHETLEREEARDIMHGLAEERYNAHQMAALLTVFRMRNISLEEFAGFRSGLIALMKSVPYDRDVIIDMCGTGGDGKNTFNVSTLASLVVAGAGYKVAKHGNAAVSSVSGSSNVMQRMGYVFSNEPSELIRQLDEYNICYMHAPLFHPALGPIGAVRRGLGVKTFFNMMGPVVNPARPKKQLSGVFALEILPYYRHIMNEEEMNFSIVHSLDGYDEISLTSAFKEINENGENIVEPEDIGFKRLNPDEIRGADDIEGSVKIFEDILQGEGTPSQNEVVIANAAYAIHCFNRENSFEDSKLEARESLLSGKAMKNFKKLIESIK